MTPGGNEITSGQAFVGGSDDGKRLIPAMGNCQHNTSWTLHLSPSTYYWSVQAIDTAFAGSAWTGEETLPLTGSLTVTVPVSATEGDPPLSGEGAVAIPWALATDLGVDLATSDATELTVPATLTIPQGSTSATFDITIEDDEVSDGTQRVTVTATAAGWTSGSAVLTVFDDEPAVTPFAGGCVPVASGVAAVTGLVLTALLALARRRLRFWTG
jgi:hypothetical protein